MFQMIVDLLQGWSEGLGSVLMWFLAQLVRPFDFLWTLIEDKWPDFVEAFPFAAYLVWVVDFVDLQAIFYISSVTVAFSLSVRLLRFIKSFIPLISGSG